MNLIIFVLKGFVFYLRPWIYPSFEDNDIAEIKQPLYDLTVHFPSSETASLLI